MPGNPFALVTPATRGLSLALTRHLLANTDLPVYATYRLSSVDGVKKNILEPLKKEVDPDRLQLLELDLTSESTIKSAADSLSEMLSKNSGDSYIHTAFLTGGVLHAEKNPSEFDLKKIKGTFDINVISHLLLIKHFSRFLPTSKQMDAKSEPAKWVHVSARVGSIEDNHSGGWYSYRSSKAALNQVIKTFDLQLKMSGNNAICVGVHPGTVKTELSKPFWKGVGKDKLFEPEQAAAHLVKVVNNLKKDQRGTVWDWEGQRVPW